MKTFINQIQQNLQVVEIINLNAAVAIKGGIEDKRNRPGIKNGNGKGKGG